MEWYNIITIRDTWVEHQEQRAKKFLHHPDELLDTVRGLTTALHVLPVLRGRSIKG